MWLNKDRDVREQSQKYKLRHNLRLGKTWFQFFLLGKIVPDLGFGREKILAR